MHKKKIFWGGRKSVAAIIPVCDSGLDDTLRSRYSGKQPQAHVEYRAGYASAPV
jgi:hypothetical protein